MYKAAFVLFLVLFYFRTDLDHSFPHTIRDRGLAGFLSSC